MVRIDTPAEWLPQRGAILLVDRAYDIEPGKRGTGELIVDAGDPRFAGHFPGDPILPGIFLIEAVAQTGALVVLAEGAPPTRPAEGRLGAVDRFKFLVPVRPGTRLTIAVEVEGRFRGLVKVRGEVSDGTALVATGSVTLQARAR